MEQRYGKDGGIDWDLNVDPKDIDEPSKTGQPVDPKNTIASKDSASAKENDAPVQHAKDGKNQAAEDKSTYEPADPEADIDSDEEAALREAGL